MRLAAELLTLADIEAMRYELEEDGVIGPERWEEARVLLTLEAFAAGCHPAQIPAPADLHAEVAALRQSLRALAERVDIMNAQVLHLRRYTSEGNGVAEVEVVG